MVMVKSSVLITLFALLTRVMATPPACLLAAVNTQDDPADLATICGDNASEVQEAIMSVCGDDADAAMSAFERTCASAGEIVPLNSANSTNSGNDTSVTTYTTMSFDPACSCNKTSIMTSTAAMNGSAMASTSMPTGTAGAESSAGSPDSAESASATGPSIDESTGGAASHRIGSFAAAAIAVAGVVASL